jgi:hypothetical protein
MQPDLESIKGKIKGKRDLIDRLTTKIPGFEGFVEKSESYEADRVIRDFIVDKIKLLKSIINEIATDFSRDGNIENLSGLDSLGLNLEGLLGKVKFAESGSTSKTSKIKIEEADKNRLLEYDWRLIGDLDIFDEILTKIRSNEDTKTDISDFRTKLRDFEKAFDERKNIILEVI